MLYYSGAFLTDSTYTWSIAYERLTDATLLARVNTPSAAVLGDRVAPIARPLTNATAP
jgi:hypothetical protein